MAFTGLVLANPSKGHHPSESRSLGTAVKAGYLHQHPSSPDTSVLVIGRVLVANDADLATVYALPSQIQLTPLQATRMNVIA